MSIYFFVFCFFLYFSPVKDTTHAQIPALGWAGVDFFLAFFFLFFGFFDALLLLNAAKADALCDLKKRNLGKERKGKILIASTRKTGGSGCGL